MRIMHANKLITILLALTLLSSAVLASSAVSADDDTSVVDEINITVPVSCTLSGTGMTSHNATINNGQYNSAIGETTIKAYCNDNNGFSIYAIGYTSDTLGSNVLANATLGNAYDIETGTLTSGTNSQWAMKLSTVTSPTPTYPIIIAGTTEDTEKEQGDPDYTAFQEVPDDYERVAYRTAGTDIGAGAEGATLKTTYQAYISPTQPAGTYTGQVKYTLIYPYNAESPEVPFGNCISNATCMQTATSSSLASQLPNINDTVTLYDSRDGQAYTIAKLADGKYWMTDNLNIAGGTALSSDDTDFEANYTLPTTNGWTVLNGKLMLPASSTSGFDTAGNAYVYNSEGTTCANNSPCYSYYSFDAAVLGSERNNNGEQDAAYSICPKGWKLPTSRYSSPFDATVATESDLYDLAISYGMSTGVWEENAGTVYVNTGPGTTPNFLRAGLYYYSSFYGGGAYYWSSRNDGINNASILSLESSFASTAIFYESQMGLPVRCLFAGQ